MTAMPPTPLPPSSAAPSLSRRQFVAAALAAPLVPRAFAESGFAFRYLLASAMYGQKPLDVVCEQARSLGMASLDLWPKVHGGQREEVDLRGAAAVHRQVADRGLTIDCLTRYDLGADRLDDECRVARTLGATTIVSGPKGRRPRRDELRPAVERFVRSMQPHVETAAENGVAIAIENHRSNLFEHPDSLRYLADLTQTGVMQRHLMAAVAPAHLDQDAEAIAGLVRDLGPKIAVFYAWERGNEFLRTEPTGRELEQLPGRGSFDFAPVVAALAAIDYRGWTSLFMHPVPRGIPAAGTVDQTTREIAAARRHLDSLLTPN